MNLLPPPTTTNEITFLLYESKGSLVENERLHKPESPSPQSERGEDPCCYSKHLPLCGRPSRPIVEQKLVVLPLAPIGSRGMRQTPLLFWFQICGWIDAWPRLPSPLAVALCPLSQSTVSFCFLSHPLAVRTLAGQHSYSFLSLLLYSYSPLVYMLIVLWSTLIINMVIF